MKAALFLFVAFACAGCNVTCSRSGDSHGGGIGAGAGGFSVGPSSPTPSRVVAVKVTRSGEIYFERRRVTLEELDAELKKLPRSEAGVCYFRESPEGAAHAAAVGVMRKIVEARLPVTMSPEECV